MTQLKCLKCPHCGNTNKFLYHEDRTVHWSYFVDRVTVSTLRIHPNGEHSPWGDPGTGTDPHIECISCGAEFPVPTGLALSCARR